MTTPSTPIGPADHADVGKNEKDIERTRSITGLLAVVTGDVAIAVAAIIALYEVTTNKASSSAVVSILTSAFTAIGTMTTAYFGIKAASNTAQTSAHRSDVQAQVAGSRTTQPPTSSA